MGRGTSITTGLALALLVTACAGGTVSTTNTTPSPTSTSSSTTTIGTSTTVSPTTSVSALPEPIGGDGALVVPVSERELGQWTIEGGPDWLAVGFDSLWLKKDEGSVVRIDPADGEVQAEIEIGEAGGNPADRLCQGLGIGHDAVWTCYRETLDAPPVVVRIDPTSGQVSILDVTKSADQGRLPSFDNRTWVLTPSGDQLIGVDGAGDVTEPIDLGAPCTDLAAGEVSLYVTCSVGGQVLAVDPATGMVTDSLALPGAKAGAVGEDLWVGFRGGLAQIDQGTLDVIAVYDANPATTGAVAVDGDTVWVRRVNPMLTRIDPIGQTIVETIEAPELLSGGDVVVVDGSIWVTAFDDNVLLQLSLG